MSSGLRPIAGKQPDGTQGIATVKLLNTGSSNEPMVGCAIYVSKKDTSLRNILKVEEKKNSQVEYFIFLPWFQSSRPTGINESTGIEVQLHRYKKEKNDKVFSVDETNSREIFEKYDSDEYMVIPCPVTKKFQESSFLKKWSSELLLHNNPSQVSLNTSNSKYAGCQKFPHSCGKQSHSCHEDRDDCYHFHGFKKEEEKFKFHGFQKGLEELEEQGVLLIMINHKKCKRYVIGCYIKENNSTEKYCFLLRGLEKISFPPPVGNGGSGGPFPPQPPPVGNGGSGGSSPPQPPPEGNGGSVDIFKQFLITFAKEVGVQWKFLGRNLGIPEHTIKAIDSDYNETEEKALQMFIKWQEKDGRKATPEKLRNVLESKLKNLHLAEKVQEWIATRRSTR